MGRKQKNMNDLSPRLEATIESELHKAELKGYEQGYADGQRDKKEVIVNKTDKVQVVMVVAIIILIWTLILIQ